MRCASMSQRGGAVTQEPRRPRTERLDTVNDASVNLNQRGDPPLGEGSLASAFVVLAFVAIVAAKACTPEYAFLAYLFAAASVAWCSLSLSAEKVSLSWLATG